jgi:DinB superfamily
MATVVSQTQHEVEVLRNQNQMTNQVVRLNTDGVSHAESLIRPEPAGNCMNWVVGHLLCVYNRVLPVLGQTPVMDNERLRRYDRGTPPLKDAKDAMEFRELVRAWDEAAQRMDAGLAGLTPEALDAKAPFSPSNNPKETVRSVLGVVMFHQAYHAGQTGTLRRIAGKAGAIQ